MKFKEDILSLFDNDSEAYFEDLCHRIFLYQAKNNKVYNQYLDLLGKDISSISSIDEIPLMPITFYKNHVIKTGSWQEEKIFMSSGTSDSVRSRNYLSDSGWYNLVASKIFETRTALKDVVILALLPSYLDNGQSSLVHMVDHLMQKYEHKESGFFRFEFDKLFGHLNSIINNESKRVLLIGVSFALVDFCKKYEVLNEMVSVMFTGGMKKKQEELTIPEIAGVIKESFPYSQVWSEYGMTELTSQAYSREDGLFIPGPTMKVVIKEITDPLTSGKDMKTGQIGVIDLANVDTVSFILTEDLGRKTENGFNILGRMDNSDIRGCNLLYLS